MANVADQIILIDEDHLDREWVAQPEHVLKYTSEQADARHAYDMVKAHFELIEAELWLAIKVDPPKFGFDYKPTVDDLKMAVKVQRRYRDAEKAVIDAKHYLDVTAAACSALDNKKKALENLVSLSYMNYHSEPKPPGDREQRDEFRRKQGERALDATIDRREKK